jgi:predicted nucleic acid-binding protein
MTAIEPVVVDSSGWLEYITADSKADLFAPYFKDSSLILVPTIVIYEVRKVLLLRNTKQMADEFISQVLLLETISIDEGVAMDATIISIQFHLALADALIYAASSRRNVNLVTSDSHFKGLPGVTLV